MVCGETNKGEDQALKFDCKNVEVILCIGVEPQDYFYCWFVWRKPRLEIKEHMPDGVVRDQAARTSGGKGFVAAKIRNRNYKKHHFLLQKQYVFHFVVVLQLNLPDKNHLFHYAHHRYRCLDNR